MVEPLDYLGILERLVDKTRAGKLTWSELEIKDPTAKDRTYLDSEFQAYLEDYRFYVGKARDSFVVGMIDTSGIRPRTVFEVKEDEEIVFRDPDKERLFQILSDLYELARRMARNIPEKIADAAELLDRV